MDLCWTLVHSAVWTILFYFSNWCLYFVPTFFVYMHMLFTKQNIFTSPYVWLITLERKISLNFGIFHVVKKNKLMAAGQLYMFSFRNRKMLLFSILDCGIFMMYQKTWWHYRTGNVIIFSIELGKFLEWIKSKFEFWNFHDV